MAALLKKTETNPAQQLSRLVERGRYKEALECGPVTGSAPYRPIAADTAASEIVVHAEMKVAGAMKKREKTLGTVRTIDRHDLDMINDGSDLGNAVHPNAIITSVGGATMLVIACLGAGSVGTEIALVMGSIGLAGVVSSAIHVGKRILRSMARRSLDTAGSIVEEVNELAETTPDANAKIVLTKGNSQIVELLPKA
ncbi:hypothetical protein KKG55_06470 [Candidatus Micrarchaeota archaeon]|nr:hypothetical protein [Candidatus Micrarchaeota archaeon]MBU1887362.1 hypothetical protein [Candidatus Micrarchaeota archaeon]